MSYRIVDGDSRRGEYDILEITDIGGLNTRDKTLSIKQDEFQQLDNALLLGRGIEKRLGVADFGTIQSVSKKVVGLGHLETDSAITPLMMVDQTLYKYVSSAWAASDKTDYTTDLDAVIQTFSTKSGSSLVSGTSTGGSTTYQVEDTGKSWTAGQYAGFCVVIEGEVKYIAENTATVLILADKLNSDTDSDYQSKAYDIFALTPQAIISNGTDDPEKYDLTTTTELDGTHVTSGKALPKALSMETHHARLWYAPGLGDDNDRVFPSDAGVAENITIDTNLNINLHFLNDGDNVQNLVSVPLTNGSILAVAKRSAVYLIEGDNILNYTSRPAITEDGCIAPKTLSSSKGTAFMLGKRGVLSIADKGQSPLDSPVPISRDIQEDIEAQSTANQEDACGVVYDNKYYIRVGNSLWYYDIEASIRQGKHVWFDMSYAVGQFQQFAVIDGLLYAGDANKGQAYLLNSGAQDDGTNIVLTVESGEISLPGRPHFWVDRMEFMAEKQTSTVLNLQVATDGGSYGAVSSQTFNADNGRYVFDIGKRCYSFKYKLTETGSQTAARIILPIRIFFARTEFGDDGTKG